MSLRPDIFEKPCERPSARGGQQRSVITGIAVALLFTWGCASADEESGAQAPPEPAGAHSTGSPTAAGEPDSVTVVFTRDEAPHPVRRPSRYGTDDRSDPVHRLHEALEWLVRGPTPEERSAGVRSWFSDETVGVVRSVEVDDEGRATIDFVDLRPLIPNASTSFGSTMLLQELNGTVFQFPEIRSAEYRMEGSCDLFWDWLQYGCQIVVSPH